LIVDDVAENRYLLEALLKGNGYQVESAVNGYEALAAARREPPDLVISDILMPVMDGFSLCRVWKQDDALKSVPFVFYTATYTDPKDERLALSLGADRFIVKPVEPEVFVKVINEVLVEEQRHALGSRAPESSNESGFLRGHNDALVRKLERKVAQLEEANRALSSQIAERERVDQALREREAELRRIVQKAPIPIAVVGEDGAILHLNQAFTSAFGYSRADVPDLAAWWSRAIPDELARRDVIHFFQEEVESAASEGRDVEAREVAITGKDGVAHTVELHVAKLGKTALVVFNDITERRRLEVLRDQFLAAAAHELKTPVTTIKGYSQLLLRWAPTGSRPPRERVAIATIDAQCDRIQRRVDEMLAAARYRTGLAPIHAQRVDLGALAEDVVRRLQATTDAHRLVLEAEGPVFVEADPERLDEALATLVDRALRASPEGRDVHVRLWVEGGEARLSVSGRGLVVPEDQGAASFEPWSESLPPGGARHLPPVELGPYLARLSIERQKGRVWFERNERDGSAFVVALPHLEAP
jgi:PAS domain S-box-containing protein